MDTYGTIQEKEGRPVYIIPKQERAGELCMDASMVIKDIGWCQNRDAIEPNSEDGNYESEELEAISMLHALLRVAREPKYPHDCYLIACLAICDQITGGLDHLDDEEKEREMPYIINEWSDNPRRTKQQVLNVLERAWERLIQP